ncbi:MAG: MFS transporter [Gemmatimonadota bacterium]
MASLEEQVVHSAALPPTIDLASLQRRTLRLLFATQIISGIGVAIGSSVGALLAAQLADVRISGFALSAIVVGSAVLALPATAIVQRLGRRLSLATTYSFAALGAIVVVLAALRESVAFLFVGFFFFGGGTAAGLQARYAAVDLAAPVHRGRHLSIIVWATTLGAVAGPNFAALAGASLNGYGIPTLAGPFVFSAVLFAVAAVLLLTLMRPDPAIVARQVSASSAGDATAQRGTVGMRVALGVVLREPSARLGVIAMAVGHVVMIAVMAMTPVHIRNAGHGAEHTLRIVGVVLSVHIAGMYAFAPVVGWLTDRIGRRAVILMGIGFLLAACAVAGTAGHQSPQLALGLMLLGIGWSSTMVAGSTMLSESVSVELRAAAQGLSDFTMGLASATAGALSGVIMQAWGFPLLALGAALATIPLVALSARHLRA